MRRLLWVFVFALFPASAWAQEASPVVIDPEIFRASIAQALRLNDASATDDKSVAATPEATEQVKIYDWKWKTLAVALPLAQFADTRSTLLVQRRCPTCPEDNPFVAPFVRYPKVMYAGGMAIDAGVLYLMAQARKHPNPAVRKLWWVVPVVMTTLHTKLAITNQNKGYCGALCDRPLSVLGK